MFVFVYVLKFHEQILTYNLFLHASQYYSVLFFKRVQVNF